MCPKLAELGRPCGRPSPNRSGPHFDDEAATAKTKKRREFGAHYTSEVNILKVIKPLFLDGLREEFEKIRRDKKKLRAFHQRLATLSFFDPACGCGNFLVIAYRELRLLELDVIEALWGKNLSGHLDIDNIILCTVDQFHGLEIDGSAAQISKLALWLTDHQMNLKVQRFGNYFKRLPLGKGANIVCGNALRVDWTQVIAPNKCGFIMGNPPFIGKKEQTAAQKADLVPLFAGVKGAGVLDYVTGWYMKAADYIKANPDIPVAFVSTNSICQGEQVGVLWPVLLGKGVKIQFAHRTFQWSNEGKGVAAVHCVIIGFGLREVSVKWLFDYDSPKAEPIAIKASNINPYLVDAENVCLGKRKFSLSTAPTMNYGSMPIDDGHLILSDNEKEELWSKESNSRKYIRQYMGGDEFINGQKRWCLWLVDAEPKDIKQISVIGERVKRTKDFRSASDREATKKLANYPMLFGENRQPSAGNYLLLPKVSSENRYYMPIGFIAAEIIANGSALIVPSADKYAFGVLSSVMHNAWMRSVCGRMKSDYQYSASIVYNNFPWPKPTEAQQKAIEAKAKAVLDTRALYPDSTLADLYDPLTMPPNLTKAHAALDKAVDAAYGYKGDKNDAARVAFLFGLYQQLVAPTDSQPAHPPAKSPRKARTKT